MRFGYSCDFGEIAPSIFRTLSAQKRTKLFLALYNSATECALKIPLKQAKCGNIMRAFEFKIEALLRPNGYKKAQGIKFIDLASTAVINAYKQRQKAQNLAQKKQSAINLSHVISNLAVAPALPVARLITLCHAQGNFEIWLGAQEVFTNYVFEKISAKQQDKDVTLENGVIYIKENNEVQLAVLPSFSQIDCEDKTSADAQIKSALKLLRKEPQASVYVVAPRSPRFNKKIQIRHCEQGVGEIKLVPYTIVPNLLKGE
ncbi:hypothetical protein [Campylobacter sp. 19-13652]|uniref:hypothetical protein n=1 Tax=Campylobacter sp. 19-13652 TaxID=2840180 RepID=UPI001C7764CE|nr:hypothetical protein [Campylobacter sp. 19-13652]BCX80074.1 hypothetical protein LBC_15360 [Campylobacter sp. 19-13652]